MSASGVSNALSANEAAAYREDGFFVRRNGLDGAEIDALREAVEAVAERLESRRRRGRPYRIDDREFVALPDTTLQFESGSPARLRVVEPVVHLHPRLDALVDDPRLIEPMRALVGGEVSLFTDKLNLKRPLVGAGSMGQRRRSSSRQPPSPAAHDAVCSPVLASRKTSWSESTSDRGLRRSTA